MSMIQSCTNARPHSDMARGRRTKSSSGMRRASSSASEPSSASGLMKRRAPGAARCAPSRRLTRVGTSSRCPDGLPGRCGRPAAGVRGCDSSRPERPYAATTRRTGWAESCPRCRLNSLIRECSARDAGATKQHARRLPEPGVLELVLRLMPGSPVLPCPGLPTSATMTLPLPNSERTTELRTP